MKRARDLAVGLWLLFATWYVPGTFMYLLWCLVLMAVVCGGGLVLADWYVTAGLCAR